MKHFLFALILGVAATAALAQQPAPPPAPSNGDPSVLELKAELAEANLTAAQLRKQISELQIALVMAQRAAFPSIDQVRDEASRSLTSAVEAAHAARMAADNAQKKASPSSK